ncbi:hypothetical protein [Paraburkholderia sp.]|uniref:hypothetical protein n=1 Tax=Paraburkholderia sp. TaxID=1926495 RepID=UPI0025FC000C|nr:hypothetical protein [Paraburkholderia sp.]
MLSIAFASIIALWVLKNAAQCGRQPQRLLHEIRANMLARPTLLSSAIDSRFAPVARIRARCSLPRFFALLKTAIATCKLRQPIDRTVRAGHNHLQQRTSYCNS